MDWENRTVSLLLCLSVLLATVHDGNAERKVVCYYTNWSIYRPGTAKFSPQNINPYLCTHLIYAFGGFTKDNALKPFDKYQDIEKGGYAKFTGLKTYNKNLKTLLAIGGWNEGSSRFSPMVADPERRREFVKHAVKFLRKNHFDGLDLDWEYPAFRDGGKPRDKDNYASLVQELREEFERESSKTGRPRLLLTLAMPAGIEYIDKGYDVPRLNEYLDFINLLSYDYHSSYEPAVNHHSPLYPLEEDNEYNYDTELTIDYTIEYLLKKGASSEKIILGIPTYGRSYTLFNEDATDLGSPADGPGVEGDATREKGYLAYYEICENFARSDEWEVIQPNPKAMGPYAFKGNQWVGYDDEDIVRLKAKYANEKKLGGIMFWTIDNDDFRGKCHDRPYPLIEAAKEALLTDDTNPAPKAKTVDRRKKPRVQGIQSNAIGRKLGSSGRRTTTTAAPAPNKRIPSSRPRYRTFTRSKASDEEEEEEEEREVGRRSYHASSVEEEEDNSEGGNAVRAADKNDSSRNRDKSKPKARLNSNRNRRKQDRRKEESKDDSRGNSLGDKLTTPEPPTTPDPGSDFKCEDEGFFPHPRDCKKYFWCLDSGPGGLGVVAHQFTCPSGLVFNKAADSCDYPRNVVCPKSKTSRTTASTTRAPITAATSRTTYLYSTTRRSSTEEPDTQEEYEYYDDDEEEEVEEEKKEDREEKVEPKVSTTPKPFLYKTIARNKPSTTTTTTTEIPSTTPSRSEKNTPDKIHRIEDEEDPRVIKELIKLIKKAGGIEELEKQLLLQDKNLDNAANPDSETATPATISRTLYERVLNRQAGKAGSKERASADTGYANGPGRAQFDGLDEVPEVKSLRRSQKPQYVTIERPKPSTKEPPVEDEEDEEEEDLDDDNEDVASSEEQTVSDPFSTGSTRRATPSYINIRRGRPSTSRNENDVDEKDKDTEEDAPVRRRRPSVSSKNDAGDEESSTPDSKETPQTTKSRYVSVQRFRSTTSRPAEVVSVVASTDREPTTESAVPSEAPKIDRKEDEVSTTPSINVESPIAFSSTPNDILVDAETEKPITNASPRENASSTTESVKLVEDSATEILLTTAPARSTTLLAANTRIESASASASATVSQPRPFGFNRRNRPASEITTTPLPASNDQTRSKVANSEANRLPTLKELIGYRTIDHTGSRSPAFLTLLPRSSKDRNVYPRENYVNRVLETDATRGNAISSDTEPRPWTLTEHGRNEEKSYAVREEFDLSGDKINAYYAEDDIADNENDGSLTNKKRFDREDSSTTTLRPTTMRGIPLVDLLQSSAPRGFYVTRDEKEVRTTGKVEYDTVNAETKSEPTYGKTTIDLETDGPTENREYAIEVSSISTAADSTIASEPISFTASSLALSERTIIPETTDSKNEEPLIKDYATPSLRDTESALRFATRLEFNPTSETLYDASLTKVGSSSFDSVTEAGLPAQDETSAINLEEDNSTDKSIRSTHRADQNEENLTKGDEESKTTPSISTSTRSSTTVTERSETKKIRNDVDRRRQRVELVRGREFGRKSGGREQTRPYVRPSNENQNVSTKDAERTQYPRRRVTSYRGRQRFRPLESRKPVEKTDKEGSDRIDATTAVPVKETGMNNSVENHDDREGSIEGETSEKKKLVPMINRTRSDAVSIEERLRIEENVDGFKAEVNPSTNTEASRAPGNLSSTRLKKPTTLALTPLRSKTPNALASHRKTRPTDGNSTLVNEKLDAPDEIIKAPKLDKDIDQSSKAQEIAVTLADPPSLQSPATGRPPLRNGLRRKIGATVASRADATTIRTTLGFASTIKDRQRPKAKDKPPQNVTTRTRRPPVVDYDYYEDEEEPVIRKTTLDEKLFLTSKGAIRCLDQGNFPHPYSCKKFITCAKMVNGLVIGAEYTCPDKLSFDPVGGICNWSAGLGCKE